MSDQGEMLRFWRGLGADNRVRWGARPHDVARFCREPVYLATPYSLRVLRDGRFCPERARAVAALAADELYSLMVLGVAAYAPIVQSQGVIEQAMRLAADGGSSDDGVGAIALDAAFWERMNAPLLLACQSIYVPDLGGWAFSAGIRAEVGAMLDRNRLVMIAAVCPPEPGEDTGIAG